MRRIAVLTAALAALFAGAAGVRAADTPDAAPTVARLVSCDTTSSDRSAVFYGRMAEVPGTTARMAMRFVLLERLGRDGDWSKVDVPSLRQWHRAAAGVDAFGYKQTVHNLRAGAAYKAHVQYRWSTSAGDLLGAQTRDTPVCRGALPNLTVGALEVRAGPTDDTRSYRVTVDNDGKGDADGVDVVLSVDRAVLDAITIVELNAGDSATVTFTGPACGRSLRVRLDPSNVIGELVEDDNTQLFDCPAPG